MKRIVTATILFAFSVLLSSFSLLMTGSIAGKISGQAEELERLLSQASPQVQSAYEELERQWDKDYKILSAYVSHQHLEGTEKDVVLLGKYIEMGNYRTAEVLCAEIAKSIRHLHISEKPELQNIL